MRRGGGDGTDAGVTQELWEPTGILDEIFIEEREGMNSGERKEALSGKKFLPWNFLS